MHAFGQGGKPDAAVQRSRILQTNGVPVAKPNYSFEKRQRDIAKKKKKEEKLQKKREKSTATEPNEETPPVPPAA